MGATLHGSQIPEIHTLGLLHPENPRWSGLCGAQLASESFVSDAAMEATLQGRADFAGTLADLGFLPRTYVNDACSTSGCDSDADGHAGLDEYSGNARVIKAAICAGASVAPKKASLGRDNYMQMPAWDAKERAHPQSLWHHPKRLGKGMLCTL